MSSSTDSTENQTLTRAQPDGKRKSQLGGLDATYDSSETKQIAPRQEQQQQVTSQSRSQSGAPAVRLDMDLDMEIELKAKIKGDVTLSIIDDNKKQP
ncbi:hypothetical protein QBC43DRAFT_53368 [Cladorrhinum sp. PSN259]|nr:hypothetical protein QBC43DRAFT_53368 [Cladorrhinum sp. PSN259]